MTSWLPRVRVAACNVAPVFLDTAKTVQKTVGLIQEAASNRADLVVFPEVYIPAYPLWSAIAAPIDNHHFFKHLARESLLINGPEISLLKQACAQSKIFAHVGFNERSPASLGCIYNSSVLISDEGRILNHARKLVPTFYEKLTWANGDGKGLEVVGTGRCGRVGSLICGENTNPLARWALMAQEEQLHITTWPAVWPTRRPTATEDGGKQYDNIAANRTRTAAHCFEAKCFGVMCSGFMDQDMKSTSSPSPPSPLHPQLIPAPDAITKSHPSSLSTLESLTQGASMFLDPTGSQFGDMVQGEEGIAYADLDLEACVEPKQFHDVVGGYQRFDVFDLRVRRERLGAERAFEPRAEEDGVIERVGGVGKGNDDGVDAGEDARARKMEGEHAESPGLRIPRQGNYNVAHGVGGLRMM